VFAMSENLKDLINKAEENEKTQAQLEKTVEKLERKIAKLEKRLKENQSSSKLELGKPTTRQIEPEEITILKDLISTQNQELAKRYREKETLQQNIKDLNDELISIQESLNDDIRDQVIIKTQNSLNNLIEDYGRLENTNIKLKEKISEIEIENERLSESTKTLEAKSSNVERLEEDTYSLRKQLSDLENTNKKLKEKISGIEMEKERLLESTKTLEAKSSNVERLEEDTYSLRKQLSDLEEVNKILEDYNLSLKTKELSVDNLEITIQKLENLNSELREENQKLAEKLDTVKADRFRLTKSEVKASNLEKEVEALHIENEELKQKDAILLAKTINVMETQIKESPKAPEMFVPEEPLFEEKAEVKIEETSEVEKAFEEPVVPKTDLITTSDDLDLTSVSEPEDTSLKKEMLKEESVIRKKTCPNCGNTNKDQIREFDDITKIIYTYPRIYGKMYRCGQCGTEWR
jgi:myosin heavy subunit